MVINFEKVFLCRKISTLIDSIINTIYSNTVDYKEAEILANAIKSEKEDMLLIYMAIQIAAHKICSIEYYLTVDGAAEEIIKNQKYMSSKEWYDANLRIHKSQAGMSLIIVEAYFYKWKKV